MSMSSCLRVLLNLLLIPYEVFLNILSRIMSSNLSLSFPGNFKASSYLFCRDKPLKCCSLGSLRRLLEERTEFNVFFDVCPSLSPAFRS